MNLFSLKNNLLLFTFFFMIACSSKKMNEATIGNVIPKDTMVLVFTDMHLADAYAQTQKIGLDSSNFVLKKEFVNIFSHYRINSKRFKESLKYYTAHPKEMDELYGEVVNNLSKQNN